MKEYVACNGDFYIIVIPAKDGEVCDICDRPATYNVQIWYRHVFLAELLVCDTCLKNLKRSMEWKEI